MGGGSRNLFPILTAGVLKCFVETVRHIVQILSFAKNKMSEISARKPIPGVDGIRIIVTRFARHINETGFGHFRNNSLHLLDGGGHRHRAIYMLPHLQSLNAEGTVQMSLSENGDGIDIASAHLLERSVYVRDPELGRFPKAPLRHQIGYRDLIHPWMRLKYGDELPPKTPGASSFSHQED